MREIPITQIESIHIGQAENKDGGTGCTVLVSEIGMRAGLDVRGGGPASRESELLRPMALEKEIHAIVLGGGSAFGLGAANGVMEYLESHDIGYDVGVTKKGACSCLLIRRLDNLSPKRRQGQACILENCFQKEQETHSFMPAS